MEWFWGVLFILSLVGMSLFYLQANESKIHFMVSGYLCGLVVIFTAFPASRLGLDLWSFYVG